MPNGFAPAYAGVGASQPRSSRVLWSRRHCTLFALLSLLAISLPYLGLGVATVRSMVDPPATTVALPELTLPVAQFPVRALPKISDRAAPRAAVGSRAAGTHAGAAASAGGAGRGSA